jgi:uncharacterized protein (TIGR02145 family)
MSTTLRPNRLVNGRARIVLIFILFVALILASAATFAQDLPRIAVYVTGDVPDNDKKALGTKMLATFVNSKRYVGIERSSSFIAEIEKEQEKQRSGAIDDSQISALGKQFGVKFVCIADITPAFGEFQVSARIVNVETAVVAFIGEAFSPLKTPNDLAQVSGQVVSNMFGEQQAKAQPEYKPTPKPEPPPAVAASQPKPASGSTFTDSRDGKAYRKVTIGKQTWMAENLNYAASDSKCYGNNSSNCEKYGRLYNWPTAMSACPAGWHLPSDAEWKTLEYSVGGSKTAGKKLKSKTGWYNNGNGTDDVGFSALHGGYGSSGGSFSNAGLSGGWWSTTEYDAYHTLFRGMYYYYENVSRHYSSKARLYSVRCVQD